MKNNWKIKKKSIWKKFANCIIMQYEYSLIFTLLAPWTLHCTPFAAHVVLDDMLAYFIFNLSYFYVYY